LLIIARKDIKVKMMLTRRVFAYCLLFQTAHVLGSVWGNTQQHITNPTARTGHGNENHAEDVTYETTVTTEMNYASEDSSKSEKKRSYHAEYEYISAGDNHPDGKGGKKGGHYTHAPTQMGDSPHGKGSKKGGHYTHAPTQMGSIYPTEEGKGKGKGKGGSHSESKSSKSSSESKSSKKGKSSKTSGDYPEHTPCKLIYDANMLLFFESVQILQFDLSDPTSPPAPSGDSYPSKSKLSCTSKMKKITKLISLPLFSIRLKTTNSYYRADWT
jgi:hypothetical protein